MKIALIAGARPNFMKVAPIMQALHLYQSHRAESIHTAYSCLAARQDMSERSSGIFGSQAGYLDELREASCDPA